VRSEAVKTGKKEKCPSEAEELIGIRSRYVPQLLSPHSRLDVLVQFTPRSRVGLHAATALRLLDPSQ
jgi:hypothetical protein